MRRTDINIMYGKYPFRRLNHNTIEQIDRHLEKNNVQAAYISSIESIFLRDPFLSESDLHNAIKDKKRYRHILTVNPLLQTYKVDIQKGLEVFDIKGVKIFPGYHDYELDDPNVCELYDFLKEKNIPLLVGFGLEDDRLSYIIKQKRPHVEKIKIFLERTKENICILLMLRLQELMKISEVLNKTDNTYADICGLKDSLFAVEKLLNQVESSKILFGSLFPLSYFKSIDFLLEKAEISEEDKEKIAWRNTESIFG